MEFHCNQRSGVKIDDIIYSGHNTHHHQFLTTSAAVAFRRSANSFTTISIRNGNGHLFLWRLAEYVLNALPLFSLREFFGFPLYWLLRCVSFCLFYSLVCFYFSLCQTVILFIITIHIDLEVRVSTILPAGFCTASEVVTTAFTAISFLSCIGFSCFCAAGFVCLLFYALHYFLILFQQILLEFCLLQQQLSLDLLQLCFLSAPTLL